MKQNSMEELKKRLEEMGFNYPPLLKFIETTINKAREERRCIHGKDCLECLGDRGRKGLLPR